MSGAVHVQVPPAHVFAHLRAKYRTSTSLETPVFSFCSVRRPHRRAAERPREPSLRLVASSFPVLGPVAACEADLVLSWLTERLDVTASSGHEHDFCPGMSAAHVPSSNASTTRKRSQVPFFLAAKGVWLSPGFPRRAPSHVAVVGTCQHHPLDFPAKGSASSPSQLVSSHTLDNGPTSSPSFAAARPRLIVDGGGPEAEVVGGSTQHRGSGRIGCHLCWNQGAEDGDSGGGTVVASVALDIEAHEGVVRWQEGGAVVIPRSDGVPGLGLFVLANPAHVCVVRQQIGS